MSYRIFTMASDSSHRIVNLLALLESNRLNDNAPVLVIPFDDAINLTSAVCDAYNAKLILPLEQWDNVGRKIFGNECYRKNVPAWRFYRKFNAFDGVADKTFFLDGNIILMSSLRQLLPSLDKLDFVFSHRSLPGRSIQGWVKDMVNYANPDIKDGFGAAFWLFEGDVFSDNSPLKLQEIPGLRSGFGRAPEQGFLAFALGLAHLQVGLFSEIYPDMLPIVSARKLDEIGKKISFGVDNFHMRRQILSVKWSGVSNQKLGAPPLSGLLERVLESAVDFMRGMPIASRDLLLSEINKFGVRL